MSDEWGIFNDDSADHTAEESIQSQFYSEQEARAALADRYADSDCYVHICEEPDNEDDDEEEEDDWNYPVKA